ncbi:MAG: Nif11-like leader peptide family natural product precursor [Planctomycetota bacterium]|nr:MAG: Nif11-like leader peptide family natural product precursor [Planctomycetota bacterium]REK18467.1 MAG: Nif11-like leader peptide family natural product precursor [Planctomycetota bacterium]REK39472.1 MAG: Nif11-like leader peptide family natural product precursor [Planctomycetota bacterium]
MSNEEQLTAFLDKVESDAALQEEVRKVKSVSDLVALGKQSGFSFDEDTAKSYFQEQAQSGGDVELSEEQLEQVAGGGYFLAADSGCFVYKSILGRRGGGPSKGGFR